MKYFTFLLSLLMLSACSSTTEEAPLQKSCIRVDFGTFQVEVQDMQATSRAALGDAATRLSLAVFKSDGTLVEDDIHQQSTDDAFGSVELELYPGSYQLVAVAHNGEDDADIQSVTSVILPGTKVTDTFTKVQDLTVESGKDCSLSMTLARITSAFVLQLVDTPPAHAKEIEVVVNTAGLAPTTLEIDPGTGLASNNWKQTGKIQIADLADEYPIYFIGMYPSVSATVQATAFDTSGDVIISHTLNSVSLVPNRKTIATGNFFKSTGSSTFTLDTAWEDDHNIGY